MPTLNKRQSPTNSSAWFVRKNTSNLHHAPPVSTFQIEPDGVRLLQSLNTPDTAHRTDQFSFEDDVFYILHDLGFLSTYGDGPSPGSILEQTELASIDSLTDPQRASFALALTDALSSSDLCSHESIFRFFCDLTTLPETHWYEVISAVLEPTPYEATFIETFNESLDSTQKFRYQYLSDVSPVGFAVVISYLYQEWSSREALYERLLDAGAEPVWTTPEWVCFAGTPDQISHSLSSGVELPQPASEFVQRLIGGGSDESESVLDQFYTGIGSDVAFSQLVDESNTPLWTNVLFRLGAQKVPNLTFVLAPRLDSFVSDSAQTSLTEASTPF
jgi:hypothetical protein